MLVPRGQAATVLTWRLRAGPGGTLAVRPLVSGRDYHALHHENPAFRFDADVAGRRVVWRPYPGVPAIVARSNGSYAHQPDWYRNFLYTAEQARGLDCVEDLASPGVFRWDLARGEAVLILAAEGHEPADDVEAIRVAEGDHRRRFASRLHRAADAYVVRRGDAARRSIAGYPWFTDWGRDTFIALRGLCLATGRLDDARAILLEWSGAVSEGMLPNRFPDHGEAPEFNAVDASLWFVVAVHEFLADRARTSRRATGTALEAAIDAIVSGYARGTRYGIRADDDGLLAAGAARRPAHLDGRQGRRSGRHAADRQARRGAGAVAECAAHRRRAIRSLERPRGARTRVVRGALLERSRRGAARRGRRRSSRRHRRCDDPPEPDLRRGRVALPHPRGARARRVVDAVESRLLTPLGLRTLAPGEPGYTPHYQGGVAARDGAYHQGTAWPWLMGAFVEAWVRVRGGTANVRREARARFLDTLLGHLDDAGLGHLPEIADGDAPHTPRGCPFQAWSVGEALRLTRLLA